MKIWSECADSSILSSEILRSGSCCHTRLISGSSVPCLNWAERESPTSSELGRCLTKGDQLASTNAEDRAMVAWSEKLCLRYRRATLVQKGLWPNHSGRLHSSCSLIIQRVLPDVGAQQVKPVAQNSSSPTQLVIDRPPQHIHESVTCIIGASSQSDASPHQRRILHR